MHPSPVRSAALLAPVILLALVLLPAATLAADSTRCAQEVDRHLAELPLAANEVKSTRIIERVNLEDFGPEIFGVDAWMRLDGCSGWLVINMTPACFLRQAYTRGDCRVEDVPSY